MRHLYQKNNINNSREWSKKTRILYRMHVILLLNKQLIMFITVKLP